MAKDKKSFILYADWIHTFEELTDAQAGRLIKHFLRYVNDKNPSPPDKMTKIIFEPIKQQLKRDLKKWETERSKRSEAGKKGMASRWKSNPKNNKDNSVKQPITKITDNVTVNVNDNVNVRERESIAPDLQNSNIYRKPNIPTKEKIQELFKGAGGTPEMAEAFYSKHEAVGWYLNNSPITRPAALVQKYIANWKQIDKKTKDEDNNLNPLGHLKKIS